MKKIAITLGVFAISIIYILQQHSGGSSTALAQTASAPSAATPQPSTQTTGTTKPTTPAKPATTKTATTPTAPAEKKTTTQTATAPAKQPTPTPTPAPKPKGQYKDGSYTGKTVNAYYGYVQVKATISGGKLTDVTFLQYPNTHSTSVYINRQAMPYLKQEAIQVQSANVSGVSGASATSYGFQKSLASALAQAKV